MPCLSLKYNTWYTKKSERVVKSNEMKKVLKMSTLESTSVCNVMETYYRIHVSLNSPPLSTMTVNNYNPPVEIKMIDDWFPSEDVKLKTIETKSYEPFQLSTNLFKRSFTSVISFQLRVFSYKCKPVGWLSLELIFPNIKYLSFRLTVRNRFENKRLGDIFLAILSKIFTFPAL